MKPKLALPLIVLLCCASLLASGCGTETGTRAEDQSLAESDPSSSPQVGEVPRSVPELLASMPQIDADMLNDAWAGLIRDYKPKPIAQCAREAVLVVAGSVVTVRPGRISGAETMEDSTAARQLTLEIAVVEPLKGDVAPGESIYIEMTSGVVTAEGINTALLPGTPALVMVVPAPTETDVYIYGDEEAGRPQGEPLWAQYCPESIRFATSPVRGMIAPMDHGAAPDSSFLEELAQAREGVK